MDKQTKLMELRQRLIDIEKAHDGIYESMHEAQDIALLAYIDDEIVTQIFDRTTKWYA